MQLIHDPTGSLQRFAASEGSFNEFVRHLSIGFRQRGQEAIDRFEHDPPLWLGPDDAERAEFQLRFWREPDTQLRVVSHPLTGLSAGRRSPCATTPPLTSSSGLFSHEA